MLIIYIFWILHNLKFNIGKRGDFRGGLKKGGYEL